jgi:predicted nucleic acid-binding protein
MAMRTIFIDCWTAAAGLVHAMPIVTHNFERSSRIPRLRVVGY